MEYHVIVRNMRSRTIHVSAYTVIDEIPAN